MHPLINDIGHVRPRPRAIFQDLGYHGQEMSYRMQVRGMLAALGRSLAHMTDLANLRHERVQTDWICQADLVGVEIWR